MKLSVKNNIFNKPYPLNLDKKKQLMQIGIAGFIVFSFFFVFQPFGLKVEPFEIILKSSVYYGLGTIAINLLNNLLFPNLFLNYFNEKHWTFGRNLIYGIWYWFSVTLTMILVSKFIFPKTSISFDSLLKMLLYVFLLGQSIFVIISYINQNFLNKKYKAISDEIQSKISGSYSNKALTDIAFSIPSDFDKNIKISSICFIEALGNYLKVFWETTDFKPQNIVVRKSLSELENELSGLNHFFKCHRSFIVNIHKIEKVSGDSQGLKLKIKNFEQLIPVSRSNVKEFKTLFRDM